MSQNDWLTVGSVVAALGPTVLVILWFIWQSGRDDT